MEFILLLFNWLQKKKKEKFTVHEIHVFYLSQLTLNDVYPTEVWDRSTPIKHYRLQFDTEAELTFVKTMKSALKKRLEEQGSILTVVRWPQASKNTNRPLKCLSG